MSKLRFTVVACSGEDAAFPARELNEHASSSKGYMTPKNCEYPQELVLRLADGLCRVTQVQLLSHQTHIATKIELFLAKASNLQEAAYQRLGYLTLKSNVESNYTARELKTVHIDNEATFIKLVLHQCYVNERNMYSQVGIMAVNLCGEPLEGSPVLGGELPNQSTGEPLQGGNRSIAKPTSMVTPGATDDLAFDLRFDAKTAERIRELQIAKDKAVAAEDYDQAKRLKKLEEHLKSIGLQLARLEAQKREAVANEDYDLAKRIKDEIVMLEASANSGDTQPIMPSASSPSPTYANGSSSGAGRSTSRSQVLPRAGAAAIMGTKAMSNSPVGSGGSSSFSPRDMYSSDERAPAKKNNGASFNEDSPAQSNSRRQQPSKKSAEAYEDDEDSEDPARGSGDINANFRGIPDADNLPDPEDLPDALEKENEELIGVIGLFLVKCFYSNLWNHRDAAIRKVTMDLDKYPQDPLYVVQVCSVLVQSGAGDRIAQVSLSAFRLLERLLTLGAKIRRDEMCGILANTMTQLVNKLGEPQAKVRDEASAILTRLGSAKNVGVASVMSHLTKRSKKPLGIKFLHGRLLTMKELVEKFELQDGTDHSLEGVMSFLEDTNSFAHQAKEVREVAKEITVSLFLLVGADVEGFLKSLRPKQMEEYQTAFEEAETAKAANSRSKAVAPKENSRGGAPPGASGRQQADPRSQSRAPAPQSNLGVDDNEDDESVDEYTCPFCGIVDENFDSDRLDQHFWAECRMLTPCKMCGQVIEISGLNEHLLIECELKKNHKECPRCGEAITVKFFDKHVGLNDCAPRPNPKKANRCPLCHEDVAPGKKGWKLHLLEETCPNNPRGQ